MNITRHIDSLPDFKKSNREAYVAGFVLSVALTLAAFSLVWAYSASNSTIFSRGWLIAMLTMLAVVQLAVQVLFFLHLSTERRVRWNLNSALFTALVVVIVVVGSVWIMQNLNYNMDHSPQEQIQETELDEGIRRE